MHTFPESLEHPAQTISRDQSIVVRAVGQSQLWELYRLYPDGTFSGTHGLISESIPEAVFAWLGGPLDFNGHRFQWAYACNVID